MVDHKKTFVVVGMAGSGKTTFCQRLYSWLVQKEMKNVSEEAEAKLNINEIVKGINLDPAVLNTKMPCYVDIRDTVDVKKIIKKYNLGPNGAINIALDLFLVQQEHKKDLDIFAENCKFKIIDTPGQIESFVWNFPGEYLFRGLHPEKSVILYVMDLASQKSSPSSSLYLFLTNLLFATIIRHKYPNNRLLVVLNKIDVNNYAEFIKYQKDYEYLLQRVSEDPDLSFIGGMATYFEEFYKDLETVEVSSLTGEGRDKILSILL